MGVAYPAVYTVFERLEVIVCEGKFARIFKEPPCGDTL